MVSKNARGFTLIELMIVVAIIGVLSAVAIPAFMNYMAKAKSAEAIQQLRRMSEAARVYYLETHGARGLAVIPKQFPRTVAVTPAVSCCVSGRKCAPSPPQWFDPTWRSLSFSLDDPHYYQYQFVSSGTGINARFTARAYGDLDCDGKESTFEMYGSISQTDGDPTGSPVASRDEIE